MNSDLKNPAGVQLLDMGFALAYACGLAFTVYMLHDSWPAGSWWLDVTAAICVGICVLARHRFLAVACTAGYAIAALATVVAWLADLPQEPGPITGVGLAVLLAVAVRRGTPLLACASIASAAAVAVLSSAADAADGSGSTAVSTWLTASLVGGVLVGGLLRLLYRDRTDSGGVAARDR